MAPAECYLFYLPSELKLDIIDYLDQKRDLYNVSKTCRWLEDIALDRLYKVIDLELPADKSSAWSTGGYLKLRPHVVRVIEEITIRDGIMDHTQPQFYKRRRSDAGSPENYAGQVIQEIPENQLKSFSFMQRSPVSVRLLQLLNDKHGQSLRNLSCYEMRTAPLPPSALPSCLGSLECRSVDDGETLGKLVYASKDTLQSLRLGEERALVEHYRRLRVGFYDGIPQPLSAFQAVIGLSQIQNLRHLCFTGLDVSPLAPREIEDALFFTNLEELVLESCLGSETLLSAIASIFTFAQPEAAPDPKPTPRLEKFLFRHEASNTTLKEAVVRFLNSFSGLRVLSLLFDNWSMSERLAGLITNHGQTLEELVLELRVQPRESLSLDTSRPFGMGGYSQQLWEENMDDVCRLCPNIKELGIGFPWNDEMIRLRRSSLPNLQLKTMHIRNFPESHNLAQMGDYTIKEHALKFLDWTYGHIAGSIRPQLETLSIGPAIYESRFKGSNPNRLRTPEFLRTHHFMIDWAQTRFGRWSAMVTGVSERYMEEIRNEKPLGGVFQQVWLR
ncbi:hypothetical protein PMZ80_002317 [Knufia obscura]|uniref:F-box domain-containing protein n=1 Tax=Knufia obscura TaxID=1635080 RepID=A0ABR0RXT7_9EURO|nr:hypothetical protein PMZ80_002317 [Knufia obscura]